jgi:hypothetical protein
MAKRNKRPAFDHAIAMPCRWSPVELHVRFTLTRPLANWSRECDANVWRRANLDVTNSTLSCDVASSTLYCRPTPRDAAAVADGWENTNGWLVVGGDGLLYGRGGEAATLAGIGKFSDLPACTGPAGTGIEEYQRTQQALMKQQLLPEGVTVPALGELGVDRASGEPDGTLDPETGMRPLPCEPDAIGDYPDEFLSLLKSWSYIHDDVEDTDDIHAGTRLY